MAIIEVITHTYHVISFVMILVCLLATARIQAMVTGRCDNCHTMHNSQDGAPMATYGADGSSWKDTGPYDALTRGSCLGCHGMGESSKIATIGGSEIPQVYHTDSEDLAGGNFAYITGAKGSGASEAKGHNVIDLGSIDETLTDAPGFSHVSVRNTELTCAGANGCHGYRYIAGDSGLRNLKGTHHRNVDGPCEIAEDVHDSYRFLFGVRGLENTIDKWQNKDSDSHNEYYGAPTPMGVDQTDCTSCHSMIPAVLRPSTNTISGFCATCHGDFHLTAGIGGDSMSPFTRHPTDVVLPDTGEYAAYTTYNENAPIGRTAVPGTISNTVTPGADVVTCLSCHVAHASDYPDMLRWDYSMIRAGGNGSDGCCICHTQKG